MLVEYLIAVASQLVFTIGIVFLFGYIIALCNKTFYNKIGSDKACYITGFIGTPIHECSHALMCLVFGHKINEIKLFQISSRDGTLGYVNHSYNPKNLYQRIGNLFIGIAPIFVGALLIGLLRRLLLPSVVMLTLDVSHGISVGSIVDVMVGTLSSFATTVGGWRFWVFVLLSSLISTHMTLSSADIKGSKDGLIFFIVAVLVMNAICLLIGGGAMHVVTSFFVGIGSTLLSYLLLATIISLVSILFAVIIGTVLRKLKRR